MDPSAALKWPFADNKERRKIINKSVCMYAEELVHKRRILEKLYDQLTILV